jgi:hypothetical protein
MAPIQGPGSKIPQITTTTTQATTQSAPTAQASATSRPSGAGFTESSTFERSGGAGETQSVDAKTILDHWKKTFQPSKDGSPSSMNRSADKVAVKYEAKLNEVLNDPNLTDEQKGEQIKALQKKFIGDCIVKNTEDQAFFGMILKAVSEAGAKIKEAMS